MPTKRRMPQPKPQDREKHEPGVVQDLLRRQPYDQEQR